MGKIPNEKTGLGYQPIRLSFLTAFLTPFRLVFDVGMSGLGVPLAIISALIGWQGHVGGDIHDFLNLFNRLTRRVKLESG